MTDIIVGSGPAGAIAALRLLERGRRVRLVDVGQTLEPRLDALREKLAQAPPEDWAPKDVAAFKAARGDRRTEAMLPYGSDFHLRDDERAFAAPPSWLGLRPSFAKGGLSNGWGAAVAPYRAKDMAAWPISPSELAPHYRFVAGVAPIAGERDALAPVFDLDDLSEAWPMPPSAQAEAVLARAAKRRDALSRAQVHLGKARQAIAPGCVRCGLCLYGCPYRHIFHAGRIIDELRDNPAFQYESGWRVLAFEEADDGVLVVRRRVGEQSEERILGERLFLGAGVLSTAQIVLRSLGRREDALTMLDSQHFFTPFLHAWKPPRDPAAEKRHALAQLFVAIDDPAVAETTTHFQLYTYNELFGEDLRRKFGRLAPGPLLDALSRRLIVAQGYLHSDLSPRVSLGLADGGLDASLVDNAETPAAVRRARRKLARALAPLGLYGLSPAARLGAPGSSFHCGGTLPMRARPGRLETDRLGRLGECTRTRIIDASTFPSIPATTITYSVMANASRIAAEAPLPDG